MPTFFKKVLSPRQMEYLTLDRDFNIIEKSFDVERFADCPEEVEVGKDVRLGFPELFGLEDILIDILEERQISFELEGVARCLDNKVNLYIDFHITKKQTEDATEQKLIILFKDVTSRTLLEQNLVQDSNETSLQLNSLASYKDYIDKILTSMPSVLFVTNQSGIIKTVNRATKELFGYGDGELINQPISVIFADENFWQEVNYQHSYISQNFTNVEVVCKTKKGENIFVEFSCSAIQTEIEGLENFIYVGRDITEHKLIQQRQTTQYAITRILSESATIKQAIQKILQVLCENLGWDIGEVWTPRQYPETPGVETISLQPIQLECVEAWVKPSLNIPELTRFQQQTIFAPDVGFPGRIWAKRSPLWISDVVHDPNFLRTELASIAEIHGALGFPIQDEKEILGVMTFFTHEIQQSDQDLLQIMSGIGSHLAQFIKRKEAEAALLESEERYRDLFENASDLIQCVTPDNRFVYVNRAWRETLGYTEAEIAKINALDVIHPNCQPHCLEVFQKVMSGEKIEQFETNFITKNGQVISIEGNINCKFVEGQAVVMRGMFRDITKRLEAEAALRHQQEQSERLLLNILPSPIADRLKQQPGTIADNLAEVTVLFADIVGFTLLSARTSPTELVEMLNVIFSEFDQLAERHGLEKIKTIGDAYMVVGGLPKPQINHVQAIAEIALDMQNAIAQFCKETEQSLSIRIGINTGPVVAGVIGIKKFSYDLWGDTVNIASRMESHGLAGKIQVTETTYNRLREQYIFQERGLIQIKGKGKMNTYFLVGRKE